MAEDPAPAPCGLALPAEPIGRLMGLGAPFHVLSPEGTLAYIVQWALDKKTGLTVVTPNLDFLRHMSLDAKLRAAVMDAGLVLADGWPPVRWLANAGWPLPGRVTGSDLTPALFAEAARHGLSVYILGASPASAQKALDNMKARHPSLRVAGRHSPPLQPLDKFDFDGLAARLAEAAPDFVFVAMGMGKQEGVMAALKDRTPVRVWLGVGGSIDFLSGAQRRAPRWTQKIHMEWFWRFACQPRRMFKRYFGDGMWLLRRRRRHRRFFRQIHGCPEPASVEPPNPAGVARESLVERAGQDGWLALPLITCAQAQERFLRAAQEPAAAGLDLSGRGALNPLELAALALALHRRPLPVRGIGELTARQCQLEGVAIPSPSS